MRKVFNDDELERRFQEEGYVVVNFLDTKEVNLLLNAYEESIHKSGGLIGEEDAKVKDKITYDFTFIDKNIDYKREVKS